MAVALLAGTLLGIKEAYALMMVLMGVFGHNRSMEKDGMQYHRTRQRVEP